nr:hypothetical protein SHINE37_42154 [Rhizobiaceae bacterium]
MHGRVARPVVPHMTNSAYTIVPGSLPDFALRRPDLSIFGKIGGTQPLIRPAGHPSPRKRGEGDLPQRLGPLSPLAGRGLG